ncbi:O-antigen ligase [Persicobacter sp. CCB-QB2]|uniref:O-antigen ligase family protein n=1 Tax=Persicobacter sp. CCB-QB2 TaxID=1561025 RepID=UPI0006A96C93|nr:O-antigen ligase family protein [Persicobacter sp. CCB-QB2]
MKIPALQKPTFPVNHLIPWLIVILGLKILGFFTLSENITITRGLKILIRMACTGTTAFLIFHYQAKGYAANFRQSNSLVFWGYCTYLLLALFSFLWSTDVAYSALQWFMDTETFIFSMLFIRLILLVNQYAGEHEIRLSDLLSRAVFLLMAWNILGAWFFPDTFYRLTHGQEVARLGGFLMNPNELGMLAVVGIAASYLELFQAKKNHYWDYFRIACALYALILTGSRSSMIGFLLVSYYAINLTNNRWFRWVVIGALLLSIPIIVQFIFIKEGDLKEVLSMTGRLPFWKALLTEGFPKQPWLGFGFMRISNEGFFQSVNTYAGKMTHNTFIQVLMNLGIIGFFICLSQLALTLYACVKSKSSNKKRFFTAVFIPVLINSFTEFGIFGETNYGILFYQLLFLIFVIDVSPHFSQKQILKIRQLAATK